MKQLLWALGNNAIITSSKFSTHYFFFRIPRSGRSRVAGPARRPRRGAAPRPRPPPAPRRRRPSRSRGSARTTACTTRCSRCSPPSSPPFPAGNTTRDSFTIICLKDPIANIRCTSALNSFGPACTSRVCLYLPMLNDTRGTRFIHIVQGDHSSAVRPGLG